jgi:transcription initiation factor TFIID subunit 4
MQRIPQQQIQPQAIQTQNPQQQQNIVTLANGQHMTQQQLQQLQQLKFQQQQQQQQIKNIPGQPQQILIQSAQCSAQFTTIQPQQQQYQTITTASGSKIIQAAPSQSATATMMSSQQAQMMVKSGGMQLQAQSPQQTQVQQTQIQHLQQQQQQKSPSSSVVKIISTQSPSSAISPLTTTTISSSPVKMEPQHYSPNVSAPQPQLTSPKIGSKLLKAEELSRPSSSNQDDIKHFSSPLTADHSSMMDIGTSDKKSTSAAIQPTTTIKSSDILNGFDLNKLSKQEKFLNVNVLHKKLLEIIVRKHKLDSISPDCAALVSHATQQYLRNILEKLNIVAQHRLDMSMRVFNINIIFIILIDVKKHSKIKKIVFFNYDQTNEAYEVTNDVKSQIKFIEELDKIEKKKKDEAEREKLLKAAKVIS